MTYNELVPVIGAELLPCPNPWCKDSRPTWVFRSHNLVIECQGCGMAGPHGDTEAEAITAWNTRHRTRTASGEGETPYADLIDKLRRTAAGETLHPGSGDAIFRRNEADVRVMPHALSGHKCRVPAEFACLCFDNLDIIAAALSNPPAPPSELSEALEKLRGDGWMVAVHNDYRVGGEAFTFWLFTHADGRWIKGEGRTDDEALTDCARAALSSAKAETTEMLAIPPIKPAYAEEHPLLAPIIAKRAAAAGNFSPEFSGQRGQDFDRGLLCAFEAVNGELQRITALQASEGG